VGALDAVEPGSEATARPVAVASVATAATNEAPGGDSTRPAQAAATRHQIGRAALDAVLDRGLGVFLGRVEVEPAREGDRVIGYRLVGYRRADDALARSGLRPGDILTRVNGQAVLRPEHAFAVWQGLRVASGVSVEYLRGGRRREMRFEIVD
jgi:type II secretory pathway component PulC